MKERKLQLNELITVSNPFFCNNSIVAKHKLFMETQPFQAVHSETKRVRRKQ